MKWNSATSVAGPAVAYSPERQAPVIAWRGNRNSRNLTLAYVLTDPWGHLAGTQLETHVGSDASAYAPAVQDLPGYGLALAWVGVNGARTLNVAGVDLPSGSRALKTRDRRFVTGGGLESGGAGPTSLDSFDVRGISVACPNDSGQVSLATATTGLNFGSPDPRDWGPAAEGAALGVSRAAWTRTSDDRLELQQYPLTPTARAASAQSSVHRPSLAEYRGRLYIAWVGTDGDNHLNVAPIDHQAWQAGGDPIDPDRVDTLTELSLAAPALLTLPATDLSSDPDRLAIFWTGVDGAGTINGAVVYP
jgi:hypothetical protein